MYQNEHGGDLYNTAQKYKVGKERILDFSANINPLGISQQLREMLIAGIDGLVHYPDPQCNLLREKLAFYTGVPKEGIIPGNGASELIYLLMEVLRPRRLLLPAPCFAEYGAAAERYGTEICYYELKEQEGFKLEVNDFLDHMAEEMDAVLICNPNNPTSVLTNKENLLKIIAYAEKKNIKVILDEAFIELTVGSAENSAVEYLQRYKNLFILRALTKILAIPGLRLGYALGCGSVIKKMWEKKIPWSVNEFACSVGNIFPEGIREYLDATKVWLAEEKERLSCELTKIPELKVFQPDSNFILLKILDSSLTSGSMKEMLISRGILIRDASNFKFLNDRFIRVAIKDRNSNTMLIEALKNIFSGRPL